MTFQKSFKTFLFGSRDGLLKSRIPGYIINHVYLSLKKMMNHMSRRSEANNSCVFFRYAFEGKTYGTLPIEIHSL